jgi:hypothetical protein
MHVIGAGLPKFAVMEDFLVAIVFAVIGTPAIIALRNSRASLFIMLQ